YRALVASGGGSDIAHLYDSAGNDTFISNGGSQGGSSYAYLAGGSGGTAFLNQVYNFTQVNAYSSGGQETAYFYGSTVSDRNVDDIFYSYPTFSYMHSPSPGSGTGLTSVTNIVFGFKTVNARSDTAGATLGNDSAFVYAASGTNNLSGGGSTLQLDRVTF